MQRMCNDDECMLGGVMEEKRGTVRAVHLAGGRSPGRVRSSARACSSRGRSRWLRCSAHGARLCASWQVRAGEAAMGGDEIESGTVRAVHLAGGRSPGRVGRAPRVLKSIFLTLACASCSADAEDVQRRRVHAWWSHGGEAWDGARCPPRWRPLAGPCGSCAWVPRGKKSERYRSTAHGQTDRHDLFRFRASVYPW